MSEFTVATVDELGPNDCKQVNVDGIEVALFRIDDEYYAVLDQCPHRGASLSDVGTSKIGEDMMESSKGGINPDVPSVYCPWHHWEWNLESGENVALPRERTRTFNTKVEGNDVKIVL